jgi:hypothetical protein
MNIPAFPVPSELCQDLTIEQQRGMTLRDYFAAKAMQMEMQSTKEYYNKGQCDVSEWRELFVNIAEHAYDMADEMMIAREE